MKVPIKIQLHNSYIRQFGDLLLTVAELAHHTNLESVVISEFFVQNKYKFLALLDTGKHLVKQLKLSEAISLYVVLTRDIEKTESNKAYHALLKVLIAQLDKALLNANVHPNSHTIVAENYKLTKDAS